MREAKNRKERLSKKIVWRKEMIVKRTSWYKDGGTAKIETDNGTFYLDYRLGSTTKGKLFDAYPGSKDPTTDEEDAFEVVKASIRKRIADAIREYSSHECNIRLADEIESI
jgi:hypothetical protein